MSVLIIEPKLLISFLVANNFDACGNGMRCYHFNNTGDDQSEKFKIQNAL